MEVGQLKTFFERDLWHFRLRELPPSKAGLYRYLRVITLAVFQFGHDKCALRASALTFFTLMSIVPVLAMSFGIAKGFGFETFLEEKLREAVRAAPSAVNAPAAPGDPVAPAPAAGPDGQMQRVVEQAIQFSRSMLENAKGGVIAGIGLAILFWTIIKVLGNIEASFNDIWGIKKHRTMLRKFSDYLSFIFITPVLLFMASSLTVFVTSQVTAILNKLSFLGPISGLILFGLRFIPFVILWVLFSFTYMFMPNTKVKFKSAFFAALIAGTGYQIFQWVYINFQIGATKANAIYGSFAALPLFLTWLQVSWMIVLLGAEVSYAHQNVDLYEWMEESKTASTSYRRLLMMAVVHRCVARFCRGKLPPTLEQLTHYVDAPPRLVRDCVDRLIEARILSEVAPTEPGREPGYQPARDVENLTIVDVLDALDHVGYTALPLAKVKSIEALSAQLESVREGLKALPANVRLRDIIGDHPSTADDADDENDWDTARGAQVMTRPPSKPATKSGPHADSPASPVTPPPPGK